MQVTGDPRPPFSWTSRGLEFSQGYKRPKDHIVYQGKVALLCKRRSEACRRSREQTVAVELRKIKGVWYRFCCARFHYTSEPFHSRSLQTFYIPQPGLTTTPRFSGAPRDVQVMVRDRMYKEKLDLARERDKARRSVVLEGLWIAGPPLATLAVSLYSHKQ